MSAAHGHDEPLPEPNTPMWLPALGGVLFLMVAIWWTASASPADAATTTSAATANATASAAPPAPTASAGQTALPARPMPGMNPRGGNPKGRIQDMIRQQQAAKAAQGGAPGQPAAAGAPAAHP